MGLHQNRYQKAIIVPTLTVRNGSDAIAFYQKALGATILMANLAFFHCGLMDSVRLSSLIYPTTADSA